MKIFLFMILSFLGLHTVIGQDAVPYQFYNHKGRTVKFQKMAKNLAKYDVVFIGEHHDNSINHWLELQLTKSLYQLRNGQLTLGAEMFERDNQSGLNDYLSGEISNENLKDSVRLWNNYKTDYKPLVDFAKDNKLKFIATNIPRRYASIVAKKGLDSLNYITESEKKFMMKQPIEVSMETPGYEGMVEMMAEHARSNPMQFVQAQAVKDATMAESIFKNLEKGKLFIHYNGDYHSKEYGGIVWYLRKLNPNLKIAVISVFESKDENLSLPDKEFIPTDYMLVYPKDMTKTY